MDGDGMSADGTVGDGDKFDRDGRGWGQIPIPIQLSTVTGTTWVRRYQKGKTRKVKPIWIVSGSGISWAICKSAPRPRQVTMPASHHSVFYRLDALPAAQPTASKH